MYIGVSTVNLFKESFMRVLFIILALALCVSAKERKVTRVVVKTDTIITIKQDTIKTVKRDSIPIIETFNDTAILMKVDTVKPAVKAPVKK
jgi:hypothetical protein